MSPGGAPDGHVPASRRIGRRVDGFETADEDGGVPSHPDPDAARRLLGVAADSDLVEIRRAYRSLMRRHHPDATGSPDATRAAELAEAYAALVRPGPGTGAGPAGGVLAPRGRAPVPPPDGPPRATIVADGIISVEAPPDETFLRLLDVLEDLGEVTYRDRAAGDLGVLVHTAAGVPCAVAVSLEARSIDTLVLVDLEPLDPDAAVDVGDLLAQLAAGLAAGS